MEHEIQVHEIQLCDVHDEFRDLVVKTIQGNEFIIMNGKDPIAKIIPFKRKKIKRRLGTAKGQVIIKEGFKDIPEGFEDYLP